MRTVCGLLLLLLLVPDCSGPTVSTADLHSSADQAAYAETSAEADPDAYADAPDAPDAAVVASPLPLPDEPLVLEVWLDELPATTEGIVLHPDGSLYLGTGDGRVLSVSPEGEVGEVVTLLPVEDGVKAGTAGLALAPDGALLVCRYDADRIERVDLAGDLAVTLFLEEVDTPNSLLFAAGGTLWYTSSGGHSEWDGHIGRWRPEQPLPETVVNHLAYANGLALSEDEESLFVSLSESGSVYRIPLDEQGNPGEMELLADGPELAIADGLLLAPDGTLLMVGFAAGVVLAWREGEVTEVASGATDGPATGLASLAWGPVKAGEPRFLYGTNLMKPVLYRLTFPTQ